jgi:multisubunit Na+/H+ antiporter MnhB subunit
MNLLPILDIGLALLVLGVAAWTIAARQVFGAVVGFVVYGLLLSLVWVRLYAPDVALTEAAVGGGVTGVLLLTAGARLRSLGEKAAGEPPGLPLRVVAAILSLLVALGLAAVVLLLPDPPATLAPEAREGLAATGLGNPITAVLISYRSFDTMLEKIVLVLALTGVWSVAADEAWGSAPAPIGRMQPDGALTLLTQLLAPLGVVVGLHIFWVGADAPGGAFQGGALLAAMWMIVMMARLTEAPRIDARWLRLALIAGPAVFFLAGLAGLPMGGSFFSYPPGFAKPIILFIEAFMLLTIAVTLPMLVAGPPYRGMGR